MNDRTCAVTVSLMILLLPASLDSGEPRQGDNPFDARILDVRPRVFVRRDDFDGLTLAKLRRAARQPDFAGIRAKWRATPQGRAIRWMLDGQPKDLEAALAGLEKMKGGKGSWSDRGPSLVRMATLFDWLFEQLDPAARVRMVRRIEREADAAIGHIRGGEAPFYYSRTPGALAGVTIAGIALHGVSPKADTYLDLFRSWGVHDFFKAYDWVDGAATGATYTMNYTYVDLPQICAAWWSATGRNPTEWIRTEQGDWLGDIVRFYLWYFRPSFAFTDINDQFRGNWSTHDEICQGLDIATYVTRNGYGRAWSLRWRARFGPALYHSLYAPNYIFRDVTLRPVALDGLPRAALFGRESCGYGFFRSGWPKPGQPDTATHVFFRCGDPMNVHGGVAAGEFQVFQYAPLAARSGRYGSYDSPADQYHRNCISSNVVLFTDPAKADDRGDQWTRRGLKENHATWDEWLAIRTRYGLDVATIDDWQVSDGEARCRADLTGAVADNKCRKWIREFVWLADKHLIVLDIIRTARPEIRCCWQLHAPTLPAVKDHLITVVNQPPDMKWADPTLQPKPRQARLFCQTLAPRRYTVILHHDGQAQAFRADGQARGPVPGNRYHRQFGSHVIQIQPAGATSEVVFLNVLTATDARHTAAPTATCRVVRPGSIEVKVSGVTCTMQAEIPDDRW